MKKPEIKIDCSNHVKVWGYSFKECIDYIKYFYDIPDVVYGDLISWGDPFLLEYPIFFAEKTKNIYESIANDIIEDLYNSYQIDHKDDLTYSIQILFNEFSIEHTIENIPVLAFLTF